MNWSLTGWNKTNTNFYHLSQFVKYLVDLLAIREADVGLAHQAPHFLPDVIFAHLHENKQRQTSKVEIFTGKQKFVYINKQFYCALNELTKNTPYFHH